VTTMFMAKKVDAGEIILTRATEIGERETAGELSERLSVMGAELLAETLELIERGQAPRTAQDPSLASYARKLKKADGEIDWSRSARQIFDHIRGMTPWPGAYTWYGGKMLHVLSASVGEGPERGGPGEILAIEDGRGIEVAASGGSVWLEKVKPEGRPPMEAGAFARGYHPRVGSRPFVRDT